MPLLGFPVVVKKSTSDEINAAFVSTLEILPLFWGAVTNRWYSSDFDGSTSSHSLKSQLRIFAVPSLVKGQLPDSESYLGGSIQGTQFLLPTAFSLT